MNIVTFCINLNAKSLQLFLLLHRIPVPGRKPVKSDTNISQRCISTSKTESPHARDQTKIAQKVALNYEPSQ